MRVTHSMLFRTALASLDRQRLELSRSQEQASSGLRINRPSDDPLGAGTAVGLRSASDATAQLQRNGASARPRLLAVDDAVGGAVDLLVRARELAIQGANGTQDASTRRQIAAEIESLHAEMLAGANSRFGGAYVFAGFASDTAAFSVSGPFIESPPSSPTVAYAGDSGEIRVAIEEGATVRVSFDGRRVFMGDADGNGAPDAGREDLFDVLADLRDALMNDDPDATAATLGRIDRGLDQLSVERTAVGSELTRIATAADRLADRELRLAERLSDVEDADLARVVSNMLRQEAALQAGLGTMARVLPPTLMDFLS